MGLPLIRKRRAPFGMYSALTSRIPNDVVARSETTPSTDAVTASSSSGWSPIWYGHHSGGWLRCSCGYAAGSNVTNVDSPGSSATGAENAIESIEPATSTVTGASPRFRTVAVTVRSARSVSGNGRSDTTCGSLTVTPPVRVSHTSCQIPIPRSGASGLQSTHVIVRSCCASTGYTRTATAFVPGWTRSVTSNAYVRNVPATRSWSATRVPFT